MARMGSEQVWRGVVFGVSIFTVSACHFLCSLPLGTCAQPSKLSRCTVLLLPMSSVLCSLPCLPSQQPRNCLRHHQRLVHVPAGDGPHCLVGVIVWWRQENTLNNEVVPVSAPSAPHCHQFQCTAPAAITNPVRSEPACPARLVFQDINQKNNGVRICVFAH